MIKYRGDRLWAKLQLAMASILWGFLVAYITARVVERLPQGVRGFMGVVLFLIGFFSLDISIKGEV